MSPDASAAGALLDAAWKGSAIIVIAAVAATLLRRSPASYRHLVWAVSFGALAALPVVSAGLPQWRLRIPAVASLAAAAPPSVRAAVAIEAAPPAVAPILRGRGGAPKSGASAPTPESPGSLTTDQVTPASPTPSDRRPNAARGMAGWDPGAVAAGDGSPAAWLIFGWLAGAALFGVRLLGRVWLLRRLEFAATPAGEALRATARAAALRVGATRASQVLLAPEHSTTVPMTWGHRRAVILLPPTAMSWSPECLEAVLLHETAHVRRADWWTGLFSQAVCALYWPHPLVWWAASRLREESERACDDAVLGTGMPAPRYAGSLLEVIESMKARPDVAPAGAVTGSSLEARLRAILEDRPRTALRTRAVMGAVTLSACLLVPVAMLRFGLSPAHAAPGANSPDTAPANALRGTHLTRPQTAAGAPADRIASPDSAPPSPAATRARSSKSADVAVNRTASPDRAASSGGPAGADLAPSAGAGLGNPVGSAGDGPRNPIASAGNAPAQPREPGSGADSRPADVAAGGVPTKPPASSIEDDRAELIRQRELMRERIAGLERRLDADPPAPKPGDRVSDLLISRLEERLAEVETQIIELQVTGGARSPALGRANALKVAIEQRLEIEQRKRQERERERAKGLQQTLQFLKSELDKLSARITELESRLYRTPRPSPSSGAPKTEELLTQKIALTYQPVQEMLSILAGSSPEGALHLNGGFGGGRVSPAGAGLRDGRHPGHPGLPAGQLPAGARHRGGPRAAQADDPPRGRGDDARREEYRPGHARADAGRSSAAARGRALPQRGR
jgi:beta-lactamase regulating signal transducer with metallopeptidase domain